MFVFEFSFKKKIPSVFHLNRGDVVTMECIEKLIKKDMIHPLTSIKLKDKDIIPLQRVSKHLTQLNSQIFGMKNRSKQFSNKSQSNLSRAALDTLKPTPSSKAKRNGQLSCLKPLILSTEL